jgi:hypothetical protein
MMKFDAVAALLSLDKLEQGAWMTLKEPGGDAPVLVGGRPVRLKVRSTQSDAYQQLLDEMIREGAKKLRGDPVSLAVEAGKAEPARKFARLVTAVENFSGEAPGEQVPAEGDLISFARLKETRWIADAALRFADDLANFRAESA